MAASTSPASIWVGVTLANHQCDPSRRRRVILGGMTPGQPAEMTLRRKLDRDFMVSEAETDLRAARLHPDRPARRP